MQDEIYFGKFTFSGSRNDSPSLKPSVRMLCPQNNNSFCVPRRIDMKMLKIMLLMAVVALGVAQAASAAQAGCCASEDCCADCSGCNN